MPSLLHHIFEFLQVLSEELVHGVQLPSDPRSVYVDSRQDIHLCIPDVDDRCGITRWLMRCHLYRLRAVARCHLVESALPLIIATGTDTVFTAPLSHGESAAAA